MRRVFVISLVVALLASAGAALAAGPTINTDPGHAHVRVTALY